MSPGRKTAAEEVSDGAWRRQVSVKVLEDHGEWGTPVIRDAGDNLTSEPIGWKNGGLEVAVSTRKTLPSPSWPEEPEVGRKNSLRWGRLQREVSPGHGLVSGKVMRGSKGST